MTTYLLRTVRDIDAKSGLDLSGKLAQTVRNTGNYFFEHAVSRQLDDYEVVVGIDEIPDRADHLILSMSNFLSPSTDMGDFAKALEEKKIGRITMVGAGAQAHSYDDPITLTPGTRRFLSLLSDKSETIGVRGFYTKQALEKLGVKNAEVIGCPSIFFNLDRNFCISKPELSDTPKFAFHMTPTGHYRDNISHLISTGVANGSAYIAQSEKDLISVVEKPEVTDEDIEFMFRYYNDGQFSPRQIRDWFAANCKWFFDLESWFEYMSTMDFSLGARFHGNMAALQVNVPALNLVFDTRTREMCEFLNLPIMFLKDFTGKESIEELYDRADYTLFNKTYADKYDNYAAFLTRNNVPNKLTDVKPVDSERVAPVHASGIMRLLHEVQGKNLDEKLVLDTIMARFEADRSYEIRKLAEARKFDAAA